MRARTLISVFSLIASTAVLADDHATQNCPAEMSGIAIHENARMCQNFAPTDNSSSQSMSYFVALPSEQIVAYYQSQHGDLSVHSVFNQRTLLTMNNTNVRVAIADDNGGSQVDILVL